MAHIDSEVIKIHLLKKESGNSGGNRTQFVLRGVYEIFAFFTSDMNGMYTRINTLCAHNPRSVYISIKHTVPSVSEEL